MLLLSGIKMAEGGTNLTKSVKGSGSQTTGNLKIIGLEQKEKETDKQADSTNVSGNQNLINKTFDDPLDAKKLMFFFNDALNDLEKYPLFKVIRTENPPSVCLSASQDRKEHLDNEYKRLKELLVTLEDDVIAGCYERDQKVTDALKKFNRSADVLLVENWKVNTVRFYSKNRQKLDEIVSKFKEAIGRETTDYAGQLSDTSRKSDKKNSNSENAENAQASSQPTSRRHRHFDNIESLNSVVKYKFTTETGLKVKLYQGQITKVGADAIVNAANENLSNGAGVAGAISKEAGYELDKECRDKIKKHKCIDVTKNCVTTAGDLPCKHVIHAVGPKWVDYGSSKKDKEKCLEDLCTTVLNILECGKKMEMKVIVMPPISSGLFAVPKEMCAAMYIRGIMKFSSENPHSSIQEFHIIDIQDGMLDLVKNAHAKWLTNKKSLKPEELLKDWKPVSWPCTYPHSTPKVNCKSHDQGSQNKGFHHVTYAEVAAQQTPDLCFIKEVVVKGKMKEKKVYEFKESLQVHVYTGNILDVKGVDAIVSTENRCFSGTGGLAKALLEKAGKKYKQEHMDISMSRKNNPFPLNEVVMTQAGNLQYRNIFHVIVEQFSGSFAPTEYDKSNQGKAVKHVLEKIQTIQSINFMDNKKPIKKIAMSLFGSGKIETPFYLEVHCGEVYHSILRYVQNHKTDIKIKEIHFINQKQLVTDAFDKVFQMKIAEQSYQDKPQKHAPKQFNRSNSKEYEPEKYQYGHGQGQWKSSHQHFKPGFDPKKYKVIDTWIMEKITTKTKFDVFMESVPQSPASKTFSKSLNERDGNLRILCNDSGKAKSLTMKETIVTKKLADPDLKAGKMKQDLKCDAPECTQPLNHTDPPANCGHHYYCFVCKPVYNNACGRCKNESVDLDLENLEAIEGIAKNEVKKCVICMDDMNEPVRLKQCDHQFCRECITASFVNKPMCPVCNTVYGSLYGNQPENGKATIYEDATALPGFPHCKTFIIVYDFPDGIQKNDHPYPGQPYKGLHRQAFLPINKEGKEVLRMLKIAFQQGLTFTVGTSRTSGEENVLTWNDIHHKTRREGGPERFGYPDETYISRVIDELEAKGIHSSITSWNDF
ncbi:hypothetical protein KUTeg_005259 [Tegillarca granosa]|uniref:RING-type E3 ubiquitin transferase n=1 Tax=Tegillarca granosa TaxID=220873 RepID=A0ABQ9FNR1_TEGGR|nr:hypothetical protein KUTeg_005259 [Tegillarca granosa]